MILIVNNARYSREYLLVQLEQPLIGGPLAETMQRRVCMWQAGAASLAVVRKE